jgi:putative ABC transport system substrate-binding protein
MRRREFIATMGSAAAWPLAARAQQRAIPLIGLLASVSPPYEPFVAAIKDGLNHTGYVEGRNFAIEYRWADGHYDRLSQQARELVNQNVAVIMLVGGGPTIEAARAATTTIPIVFTMGDDPVKTGAVAALNHPGGNVTGISLLTEAMEPKRLQFLHELVPNVALIAILVNPNNPQADNQLRDLHAAASKLGVQLHVFKATTASEIEAAFANLVQQGAGAAGQANAACRRAHSFASKRSASANSECGVSAGLGTSRLDCWAESSHRLSMVRGQ